jgi:hypothetical protein
MDCVAHSVEAVNAHYAAPVARLGADDPGGLRPAGSFFG